MIWMNATYLNKWWTLTTTANNTLQANGMFGLQTWSVTISVVLGLFSPSLLPLLFCCLLLLKLFMLCMLTILHVVIDLWIFYVYSPLFIHFTVTCISFPLLRPTKACSLLDPYTFISFSWMHLNNCEWSHSYLCI